MRRFSFGLFKRKSLPNPPNSTNEWRQRIIDKCKDTREQRETIKQPVKYMRRATQWIQRRGRHVEGYIWNPFPENAVNTMTRIALQTWIFNCVQSTFTFLSLLHLSANHGRADKIFFFPLLKVKVKVNTTSKEQSDCSLKLIYARL